MTKLNIIIESAGAGSNTPSHKGLGDLLGLHCLHDFVFIHSAYLAQHNYHLTVRICLVLEHVINEARTWVSITADSNAIANAIRTSGNDVVEFVRHSSRLADIADRALSIQFAHRNVFNCSSCISNTELA